MLSATQDFKQSARHFLPERLVITANKNAFVLGCTIKDGNGSARCRNSRLDRALPVT
jgi:hypothetical protein